MIPEAAVRCVVYVSSYLALTGTAAEAEFVVPSPKPQAPSHPPPPERRTSSSAVFWEAFAAMIPIPIQRPLLSDCGSSCPRLAAIATYVRVMLGGFPTGGA